MNFKYIDKEKFQAALLKNIRDIENWSLDYCTFNINSFRSISLQNIAFDNNRLQLDTDIGEKIIKDVCSDLTNFNLKQYKGNYRGFDNNEILVKLPIKPYIDPTSPKGRAIRHFIKELHRECKKEFWNKNNDDSYKKISSFDCFNILTVKKEEIGRRHSRVIFNYNKDGWLDYTDLLIQIIYSEFSYSEHYSNKKTKRYLKKLTDDVSFGFEYSRSSQAAEINRRYITLPLNFNIIVIGKGFKKSTSEKDYIFNPHPEILSLGLLGNPFFYQPCYPLLGYSATEQRSEDLTYVYSNDLIDNDDGTVTMVGPPDFGENLKRHAYFYTSLLHDSTVGYINFLEKSIIESL